MTQQAKQHILKNLLFLFCQLSPKLICVGGRGLRQKFGSGMWLWSCWHTVLMKMVGFLFSLCKMATMEPWFHAQSEISFLSLFCLQKNCVLKKSSEWTVFNVKPPSSAIPSVLFVPQRSHSPAISSFGEKKQWLEAILSKFSLSFFFIEKKKMFCRKCAKKLQLPLK